MKHFFCIILFIIFSVIPKVVFGSGFVFENSLQQGNTSPDVTELQKILNSDKDTAITTSGPGSPGNETDYFGEFTKAAVIKFQNKYSNDILVPNNLTVGTGFVGAATREKLNNLGTQVGQKSFSSPTPIATSTKNTLLFKDINPSEKKETIGYFGGIFGQNNESLSISSDINSLDKSFVSTLPSFITDVRVYGVDPYQVKPGQKVVINGVGFKEKQNIFSFGGVDTEAIDCAYSTYCEAVVPASVPFGEQVVSLRNSQGSSVGSQYPAKVYVTQNPIPAPVLSSITPDAVDVSSSYYSTSLVIKGEGFSNSGNYIYTPLGKSGPYNSDGKTLTFIFGDLKNTDDIIKNGFSVNAISLGLPMRVQNSQGFSNVVSLKLSFKK